MSPSGRRRLTALRPRRPWRPFPQAFFFSVYTFATIGYGDVTPASWQADVVVTLESLAGLLSFGLAAGLMFARFARPNARVIFSRNAVIAPYEGGTAFEFRIVNSRKNQIVELAARVILARRTTEGAGRSYHELPVPPLLELLAAANVMASSLRPTLSHGYPGAGAVASRVPVL